MFWLCGLTAFIAIFSLGFGIGIFLGIIALMLILFVLFYVWQNIEVMKIEMDFRTQTHQEKELMVERNKLLYDIERYRKAQRLVDYARQHQYRSVKKSDFTVVKKSGE